jgi:hypothetical protein
MRVIYLPSVIYLDLGCFSRYNETWLRAGRPAFDSWQGRVQTDTSWYNGHFLGVKRP